MHHKKNTPRPGGIRPWILRLILLLFITSFRQAASGTEIEFTSLPSNGNRSIGSVNGPSAQFGVDIDKFDAQVDALIGINTYYFYVEYLKDGSWRRADLDGIIDVNEYAEVVQQGTITTYSPERWSYQKGGCYTFRVAVYLSLFGGTPSFVESSRSFEINVAPNGDVVQVKGQAGSVTALKGEVVPLRLLETRTASIEYRVDRGDWQSLGNTGRRAQWETNSVKQSRYNVDFRARESNGCGRTATGPTTRLMVVPANSPSIPSSGGSTPTPASLGTGGRSLTGSAICNIAGATINLRIEGYAGVPHWYFRIDGGAWSGVWSNLPNPSWWAAARAGSYNIEFRCDVVSPELDENGTPTSIAVGTPFTVRVDNFAPLSLGTGGRSLNGTNFCAASGTVNLNIAGHSGNPQWFYQVNGGAWTFLSGGASPTWNLNTIRGEYNINFRCDVNAGGCGEQTLTGTPFQVNVSRDAAIGTIKLPTAGVFCRSPRVTIPLGLTSYEGSLQWQYWIPGTSSWIDFSTSPNPVWQTHIFPNDYVVYFRAIATAGSTCGIRQQVSPSVAVTVRESECTFFEKSNATVCEGQPVDISFTVPEGLDNPDVILGRGSVDPTSLGGNGLRTDNQRNTRGTFTGPGLYPWNLIYTPSTTNEFRTITRDYAVVNYWSHVSPTAGAPYWQTPTVSVELIPNSVKGDISANLAGEICGDTWRTASFSLRSGSFGRPTWFYRINGGNPILLSTGATASLNMSPGDNTYQVFVRMKNDQCGKEEITDTHEIRTVTSPKLGSDGYANMDAVCGGGRTFLSIKNHSGTPRWYIRRGSSGAWTELVGQRGRVGFWWTSPQVNDLFQFRVLVSKGTPCGNGNVWGEPFSVNVISPPAPTIVGSAPVCPGESATLNIANPLPIGTYYWFNAGGALLASGPTFQTPALNVATNYFVSHKIGGCEGPRSGVTVNILSPIKPVVSPVGVVCNGASATLSINAPAAGHIYEWFSEQAGGNALHRGNSFTTPFLSENTIFYVQSRRRDCVSPRTSVQVILTTPTIPIVNEADPVCEGTTATLSVQSPKSNAIYRWFTNGSLAGTGTTFTTAPLSTRSYIYAQEVINSCGAGRTVAVDVISPTMPTVTDPGPVCPGESTVLNVADPLEEGTYQWYDATGAFLVDGPTLETPVLGVTTSFFASHTLDGCESARTTATVSVTDAPIPVVNPVGVVCHGSTANLSVATPDTAYTYEWFNEPTGGNVLGTGTSYLTAELVDTATFYVQSRIRDCVSPRTPVAVIITTPTPPIVNSPGTVCIASSATLSINAPKAGAVYEWYNAGAEGNLLSTGTSFITAPLTLATTFYAQEVLDGCPSTRTEVEVITEQEAIPAPQSVAAFCPGKSAVLTLIDPREDATYEWYDAKGTLLSTDQAFLTPPVEVNTTFYVRGTLNGCASSLVPVSLTVLDAMSEACACKQDVLFIVKNQPLGRHDWQYRRRLERELGYTVTVLEDNDFKVSNITPDIDWIFVSHTVQSKFLLDAIDWSSLGLPVVALDHDLYGPLRMTGNYANVDHGRSPSERDIQNLRPDHPIMADFPNTVRYATQGRRLAFGEATPSAVLARGSRNNLGAVIAYEKGDLGPGGDAILQYPWRVSSENDDASFTMVDGMGTGSRSLQLQTGTSPIAELHQTIKVVEGEVYSLTFQVQALSPTDIEVQFEESRWPMNSTNFQLTTGGTGLQSYGPFTYTPAVTDLRQIFKLVVSNSPGSIIIDNIQLTNSHGVNILKNGSFEDIAPQTMPARRVGLPFSNEVSTYRRDTWNIIENASIWASGCPSAPISLVTETASRSSEALLDGIYLDSIREARNLQVYPNPASSQFTLSIDEGRITNLKVLDIQGKPVNTVLLSDPMSKATIQTTDLARGMYYVLVEDENGSVFLKKVILTDKISGE